MYKRILVASGGGPWSDAAVTYAMSLAARSGAEVCILTVLTIPSAVATLEGMVFTDQLLESIEDEGKILLLQEAAQAERAGVAHATILKWGNIPEAVLQTAEEEECDLIVLGSRQMAGWKRLRMGSITNAVAAKAPQPVLVIKHPAPVPSLWRRVLVATGGSPWSDAAVDYTLALAQDQHFEVCLMHVDSVRSRRGNSRGFAQGKNLLDFAAARAAAAGIAYEATLSSGDVVTTILETATNKQCDAIVLGSRGLTGWKRLMIGSISNAVAVKAPLPVLIVKRFLPA